MFNEPVPPQVQPRLLALIEMLQRLKQESLPSQASAAAGQSAPGYSHPPAQQYNPPPMSQLALAATQSHPDLAGLRRDLVGGVLADPGSPLLEAAAANNTFRRGNTDPAPPPTPEYAHPSYAAASLRTLHPMPFGHAGRLGGVIDTPPQSILALLAQLNRNRPVTA